MEQELKEFLSVGLAALLLTLINLLRRWIRLRMLRRKQQSDRQPETDGITTRQS